MNVHTLSAIPLFQGTKDREIGGVLRRLLAEGRSFQKDAYIYRARDITGRLGVVMEGSANIIKDDVWGNHKIIENISQGQIFAKAYACFKGEALMVDVQASELAKVLLVDVNRILTTCPSACGFHTRLIRSLMYALARKNLILTGKMDIIIPESLRERVLVYPPQEAVKQGSHRVTVPFNRQQMADYLSVDKSALSGELSRMKRCGLIDYEKNQFTTHCRE